MYKEHPTSGRDKTFPAVPKRVEKVKGYSDKLLTAAWSLVRFENGLDHRYFFRRLKAHGQEAGK